MVIKERPDLTEYYSAIDGIGKSDRNFHEGDMGGQWYTPAEEPIRPDIMKILKMPNLEYIDWFTSRYEATSKLLKDWKLFASVPYLSYGAQENDMTASTRVKDIKENLEKALDYLERIAVLRESAWSD